ncbi:MAG: hypothetical protein K6T78_12865 [Alicyclobacillus sp.]|nr:hypothetical protein [Alicyclobacillus sp.]
MRSRNQRPSPPPTGLRAQLLHHPPAIGSFVLGHDPGVVRVADEADLDFLLLDAEHGTVTDGQIAEFVDVRRGLDVSILVRAGIEQIHAFGRWLDHGLDGLVVAGAQTQEDVREVVQAVKFPPVGRRGLNPFVPATGYGRVAPPVFMEHQNEHGLLWMIAERRAFLDQLPEICRMDGLDGVFFGPYDLSVDLGIPGQVTHPLVMDQICRAIETLRENGKFAGIYAKSPALATPWRERGVQFLAVGFDWSLLRTAWAEAAVLRGEGGALPS